MSSPVPVRRLVLAAVGATLLLGAAIGARAADPVPRTYAVMSLVGDQFSVVRQRPQIGAVVDANERLDYPVADALFDRMAMAAAEAAIRRARPGAEVFQASIRDARLFALQDRLLTENAESRELRSALQGLLAKHGATHLVLVTKQRSKASFKIVNSSVGSGMLSGIGFYLDRSTPLVREGANETSEGFLGSFAYVTVSLLDAAALRLVRSEIALESSMALSVDSKDAVRSWDALTPAGKVDALEHVLRRGVDRATIALLAD
jgi:hypothetical protein